MEERKDICEGYERDSVQQLDKLAKDKNERFPIYPLTYIQAVYDARTKERLDSILWKCNNVYLPWMGSAGDTRIQLPFWMRRKGIIITYKNLDEETITEKLTYDLCIADDFFRLDSSWTRITDALPVGGNITIGSNGNWFQDGVDTGFKAQGPKGDNGLTPMLRTVNNKLRYSYDGEVWNEISEYIAAWFRYQDNKIQISRDQKTWSDLSKPFTQDLYIKGYVATSSALPSTGVKQGDIYMVGPTYAAEDTEHKNPIYRMYVYNDSGWVDNGVFQSIAAGVVQTIGNSETEVMSQKAVSSIVGLDTYPVFSDTKYYVKGEIVNYGGLLYEFTADHEAGVWLGTDVKETSLREEVKENIFELNISRLFPSGGLDGSDKYDLLGAIDKVPLEFRFAGIKISFRSIDSLIATYEYRGYTYNDPSSWYLISTLRFEEIKKRINEISTFFNATNYLNVKPDSFLDLKESINSIPVYYRKTGMVVIFRSLYEKWEFYQYKYSSVDDINFLNVENWKDLNIYYMDDLNDYAIINYSLKDKKDKTFYEVVSSIDLKDRHNGMFITFKESLRTFRFLQYNGTDTGDINFTNESNWVDYTAPLRCPYSKLIEQLNPALLYSYETKIKNKNLFSKSLGILQMYMVNTIEGSIDNSETYNYRYKCTLIKVKPNTTYVLSGWNISSAKAISVLNESFIVIDTRNNNTNYTGNVFQIPSSATWMNNEYIIINTTSDSCYLAFNVATNDEPYFYKTSKIQLEQGDTPSAYVEGEHGIDGYALKSDVDFNRDVNFFIPKKVYAINNKYLRMYSQNLVDIHNEDYSITCIISNNTDGTVLSNELYTEIYPHPNKKVYSVYLINYDNIKVKVGEFNLDIKTPSNPTFKMFILPIGDSLIYGAGIGDQTYTGVFNNELSRLLNGTGTAIDNGGANGTFTNVRVIGTLGNAPVKHEGRGGWSAYTYLNNSSSDNRFYNPVIKKFDMDYYLSNNGFYAEGVEKDGSNLVIPLMLNWNSVYVETIETYRSNYKLLIENILESHPDARILLLGMNCPPYPIAREAPIALGALTSSRDIKTKCILYENTLSAIADEYSNCYHIPILPYFCPDEAYLKVSKLVNGRSTKRFDMYNDFVHPTFNGYGQMADIVYNAICCLFLS